MLSRPTGPTGVFAGRKWVIGMSSRQANIMEAPERGHGRVIMTSYDAESANEVGFRILTTANMKMAVLWVVAPRSLVEVRNVSVVVTASVIRAVDPR
jgi:hypothetical protein